MRVLLVEDNPPDRLLVQKLIRATDMPSHVTTACDGQEALECVDRWSGSEHPDLVLLDLKLPRVDGHEVLEYIRRRGWSTPVAILTGSSAKDDFDRAMALGATDYIVKPIGMEEFDATIIILRRLMESLKAVDAVPSPLAASDRE